MSAIQAKPLHEEELLVGDAGGIPEYRIIKRGAAEDRLSLATAASDDIYGVTQQFTGSPVFARVCLAGPCFVTYGATVTQGQRLTSDANGKAIPASPGDKTIGTAWSDGGSGDRGIVYVAPGVA